MKSYKKLLAVTAFASIISFSSQAQESVSATAVKVSPAEAQAKANTEIEQKAAEWVTSLQLKDASKEGRLKNVISTHLKTIRDWNNEHPYTTVPAGIDPATGRKLNEIERQIIANSAMPESVHTDLMQGLRKDLSEEQVEVILDKYTIGKVDFTMRGFKAIVPNMTAEEEKFVLENLKLAREQAVDFKSMKQISAIFEIYKTRCEQYFNANGRNWRTMYKTYTDSIKAKKAAEKAEKEKAKQ